MTDVEVLRGIMRKTISAYEYCSADPVDRGWSVLDDAISAMRGIAERSTQLSRTPAQGAVNSRLVEFFKWAMREGPWEGGDLDGGSVQNKAESLGLIVKTQYDAAKHGPASDWMFEDGDDYYVFAPELASQPPAAPRKPICCYCDNNLCCAHCGREQPDDSGQPPAAPVETERRYTEKEVADTVEKVIAGMLERGEIADTRTVQRSSAANGAVKSLAWVDVYSHREDGGTDVIGWEADTGFGVVYGIDEYFASDSYGWEVCLDYQKIGDFDDPAQAKAFAQADYGQRILGALTEAVPQGAPKSDPLYDSRNPNFGRIGGLRCERCQGDGYINVHENLPDEPCPVCNRDAPSGAERVRRAASSMTRPERGVAE